MKDDPIKLARGTRGRRPHFFENPETDVLMSTVLALAGELSVLYDRVDAMQQLMDEKGVLPADALEAYEPTPEKAAERAARRQEYIQRLFRVVRSEARVFSTGEAEAVVAELEQELAG